MYIHKINNAIIRKIHYAVSKTALLNAGTHVSVLPNPH